MILAKKEEKTEVEACYDFAGSRLHFLHFRHEHLRHLKEWLINSRHEQPHCRLLSRLSKTEGSEDVIDNSTCAF